MTSESRYCLNSVSEKGEGKLWTSYEHALWRELDRPRETKALLGHFGVVVRVAPSLPPSLDLRPSFSS